jgi:hypothetical protein
MCKSNFKWDAGAERLAASAATPKSRGIGFDSSEDKVKYKHFHVVLSIARGKRN